MFGDLMVLATSGDDLFHLFLGVEPKIGVVKPPQIIHLLIGLEPIFTIHFGVPLFLETPF